jgi:hypothetical protein
VLKYRLYEIDRIISRVISYAIITAVLAGMFAGLVLLAGVVAADRIVQPVEASRDVLAAGRLAHERGTLASGAGTAGSGQSG